MEALIDTGSEISFVNRETADTLSAAHFPISAGTGVVQLADGQETQLHGSMQIPVSTNAKTTWHRFQVMPTLGSPMLIGVDLWAKMGYAIPAPPRPNHERKKPRTAATAGLAGRTDSENRRLEEFLRHELHAFESVSGPTERTKHQIRLKPGSASIKQRYRPRNPAMQAVIDREVEEMEREGVIEKSCSPWSSPVVIVKKKDGKNRFCIDYRRVNEVTEPDAYPLPQITATLDKLRGARYLTTLDLRNGYWQVPLSRDSRPITAFTVPGKGLYQFRVMPFGLHSAPATFQRLLDAVLGPEMEPHVFVYLDDIIILNRTFDEHLRTLSEVFQRLRDANLRLNAEKCRFCVDQLKYLGHIVDRNGIRTDPEKIRAITQWPTPQTVKQILEAINAYLNGYDPEYPGLGEAPPKPPEPPTPKATAARKEVPTVGCIVQRSDAANRRKNAWLTTAPPPPPPRRKAPEKPRPSRSSRQPARVMGPLPPPPITVEIGPGHVVEVPHFSVHVSRQYKLRSRGSRWTLRFSRTGSLRSVREIHR